MKKWIAGISVALCFGGVLPARATPPIEAYGRLPGVERVQLSPSGQRYALIAVIGEKRMLGISGADGKKPISMDLGDREIVDLRWAGNNHVLVTTSVVNRDVGFVRDFDVHGIVSVSVDRTVVNVFDKYEDIGNSVYGYWGSTQQDGHAYGYFGGITYGKSVAGARYLSQLYPDIYRVDLDSGDFTRIVVGMESVAGWLLTPEGTVVARSRYFERSGEWKLFAGKDGEKQLMEKQAPLHQIALGGFGRTPDTVLVEDRTGETDVLEEVAIADGKTEALLGDFHVEKFFRDPENELMLGAAIKEEPGAFFFDHKLQSRYNAARKAFPGYRVKLESHNHDLTRMIVMTDGGNDSGTYWLVDITTGKADPIGYAYAAVHAAEVAATSTLRYKAADGLDIEGVLTLPPGRKPQNLPLVMMPHSRAIDGEDRGGFDWWAQAFASAGYAVFQPNFRGSFGYGHDFREAGFGEWGVVSQFEISYA